MIYPTISELLSCRVLVFRDEDMTARLAPLDLEELVEFENAAFTTEITLASFMENGSLRVICTNCTWAIALSIHLITLEDRFTAVVPAFCPCLDQDR